MPDVNQAAAEPSSVTEVVTENLEIPAMSTEERATWRMTGKLPDSQPSKEAPAASDTPKEAVSDAAPTKEAAAKPAPAPEAGKETQKPKESNQEPETIPYSRFKEVVAEKNEWKKRAEATKSAEAPKEPTKVEAKADEFKPLDEEAWYKEHPDATLNDWIRAQVNHETKHALKAAKDAETKAASDAKQAEEHEKIRTRWNDNVAAAKKEHADFEAIAFAKDLDIPAGTFIDAWILSRPDGARILYALGKERGELARISALDPVSQAAELRDLELKLSGKTPAVKDKAPAKPVSAAPAPPSSVSATDTAPEDAAKAAVEAGDFTRFRTEQNRKEQLASSGK